MSCVCLCLSWQICCFALRSRNGCAGVAWGCSSLFSSGPFCTLQGLRAPHSPWAPAVPPDPSPHCWEMQPAGWAPSRLGTIPARLPGFPHSSAAGRRVELGIAQIILLGWKMGTAVFMKTYRWVGAAGRQLPRPDPERAEETAEKRLHRAHDSQLCSSAAWLPAPFSTGGSSPLPLIFPCTCLGPKLGHASQGGLSPGRGRQRPPCSSAGVNGSARLAGGDR